MVRFGAFWFFLVLNPLFWFCVLANDRVIGDFSANSWISSFSLVFADVMHKFHVFTSSLCDHLGEFGAFWFGFSVFVLCSCQ